METSPTPKKSVVLRWTLIVAIAAVLVVAMLPSPASANHGGAATIVAHHWNEDSSVWAEATTDIDIPSNSLVPFKVHYTDTDPSSITFRLKPAQDTNSDEEWANYTFQVGATPGEHTNVGGRENQNVYLAREIQTDATAGDEGCSSTDSSSWGTGDVCWFYVDFSTDPTEQGPSFSGIDTDTGHRMELWVDGQKLAQTSNVITPRDLEVQVDEAPGFNQPPETGLPLELDMTVDNREDSADHSTIDAWVCLVFPSNPDAPVPGDDPAYEFYDDFVNTAPSASTPHDNIDCELTTTPSESGPNDVVWMLKLPSPSSSDGRIQLSNLVFDALRNEAGDAFGSGFTDITDAVDELYLRVVLRDDFGNLVTHDYCSGHADCTSGGPGVFDLRHFDWNQEPVEIDVAPPAGDTYPTPNQFRNNNGECALQDEPSPNSADNVCFRSVNYAPPNQAFEFQINLINSGNVEDTMILEWDHVTGQRGWSVTFVDTKRTPDTGDDTEGLTEPVEITVPPATSGGPTEYPVLVRITPEATSTAEEERYPDDPDTTPPDSNGIRTIELQVRSGSTSQNNPARESSWIQAHLAANPQGRILLGPDQAHEDRIEAQPEEDDVFESLRIRNTGNTDGPFNVRLDHGSSDSTCGRVNEASSASEITFELRRSGQKADNETIVPGNTRLFDLEVFVGRDVPVGLYECSFLLKDDSNPPNIIPLTRVDPTLEIRVVGAPDIQILELRGTSREEVNITGSTITRFVPPDAGTYDLELFLENTGNVSLDTELLTAGETFKVLDKLNLGGQWFGVTREGTQNIDIAGDPFRLDVSDSDDSRAIRIRNLFNEDGTPRSDAQNLSSNNPRWFCAGKDDPAEGEDTDPRIVCRVVLRFDFQNDDAVTGDEVEYNFTWQDSSGQGTPSTIHARLIFDHVGEVEPRRVAPKAIGTDDSADVTLDADLREGARFDPRTREVEGQLRFEFTDGSGTNDCAPGSVDTELTAIRDPNDLRSANFDLTVEYDESGSGCDIVDRSSDDTFTLSTSGPGVLSVHLDVEDENGTTLRQVTPARVKLAGSGSIDEPSDPTNLKIQPATRMPANGTQFAKLLFDDPSAAIDGVALTRRDNPGALSSFTDCTFDGAAIPLNPAPPIGDRRVWTRIDANQNRDEFDLNDDDRINATEPFDGVILRRSTSNTQQDTTAVRVGDVTMYGWGDGTDVDWQEGWNPLVLSVTDRSGDPARPAGGSGGVSLDISLEFVLRNAENGEITDTYKLSTSQGTILSRSLGHGFYAVEVFLPDGLNQLAPEDRDDPSNLEATAHERGMDSWLLLGDHPAGSTARTTPEARALEVRISSGQSVGGQDLTGAAYWNLDDIGLLDAPNGTWDNGTARDPRIQGDVGTSAIQDGGRTSSRAQTDFDPTQDPETDRRTFLHAGIRFLGGPIGVEDASDPDDPVWTTGPGMHNYAVFMLQEVDDPRTNTGNQFAGDHEVAENLHDHQFTTKSNVEPSLTLRSNTRADVPGDGTFRLSEVQDTSGLFNVRIQLPDLGSTETTWRAQLTVKADQGDVNLLRLIAPLKIDAVLDPAAGGIPLPTCLRAPGGAFPVQTFTNDRVVDLRTVPGLLLGGGRYTMTPVLTNGDGGVNMEIDLDSRFTIIGEGTLQIDKSALPRTGEVGPVIVSVGIEGPVDTARALLRESGTTVDSTPLQEDEGQWEGRLDAPSAGEYTLRIEATDIEGIPASVEVPLNITENADARIQITSPSPTDGERAMRSNGTIRAVVNDNSIQAQFINVSRQTGDGGDSPSALPPQNNVTISGLLDTVEPGVERGVEVEVLDENGDARSGTVYVNVTGLGDDSTGFNGTLDDQGTASGPVWLNSTGTATITVELNGSTETLADFDVTVQSAASDGFTRIDPSSSELEITCEEVASCEVRYSPSGLSDGDSITVRVSSDIPGESLVTNQTTVAIDDTSPTVTLTVNQPRVTSGSRTIVGPDTTVDVSAEDSTAVTRLVVRAIQGNTELGSQPVQGDSGEVSLSDLGVEDEGDATIEVTATDLAGNEATESRAVTVDATPPSITDARAEQEGSGLEISASISDSSGIDSATLFYRTPNSDGSTSREMSADGDRYAYTISSPGSTGTLEYWIQASDGLANTGNLADRNTPRTFDLSTGDFENTAPTIEIISPQADEEVQGTINVTYTVDDPDAADSLEVSATVDPTTGSSLSPTASLSAVEVDTTQLNEGEATITIEVTDGTDTAEDTVTVVVNNNPDVTTPTVDAGEGVEICIGYTPPTGTSTVQFSAKRVGDGTTLATAQAEQNADGAWCASFDLTEEGSYVVGMTAMDEDGETLDERDSEPFQVQGAASVLGDTPTGRFISTLVLAVATIGLAAFAAFGRWD